MHLRHLATVVALLMVLAGCASGPRYDIREVDTALTAAQVAAAPAAYQGTRVVWGGVIITTRNHAAYTEIEVLSYPLDSAQSPDRGEREQGRFLVRYSNYLEGVDYAPGRTITVSGRLGNVLQGKVGEAAYSFPVVLADDLYLWPREGRTQREPQVHFGIGVIFGR